MELEMKAQKEVAADSLIRSKETLLRLSSSLNKLKQQAHTDSNLIRCLETSARKISDNIDTCLEQRFKALLHPSTLMTQTPPAPIVPSLLKHRQRQSRPRLCQKENNPSKDISSIDNKKPLFKERRDQIRKARKTALSLHPRRRLPTLSKGTTSKNQPKIGGSSPLINEATQNKFPTQLELNHFFFNTEHKEYVDFKKRYESQWITVLPVLNALEKFVFSYSLPSVQVDISKVIDLFTHNTKPLNPHQLLECLIDAENISLNSKKKGIRFFGITGEHRAAVKIQSVFRMYSQKIKYRLLKLTITKTKAIQRFYRNKITIKHTHAAILRVQRDKKQKFDGIQRKFKAQFPKIRSRLHYQIHVSCHGGTEWQRLTTPHFEMTQNTQLSRVCSAALNENCCVVYVSAVAIPQEVMEYYRRILKFKNAQHRVFIVTPSFYSHLSLSQCLYNCTKTLNKIRNLIGNNPSYIVPSTPNPFLTLVACELHIPVYAGDPYLSLHLQTPSGLQSLFRNAQQNEANKPLYDQISIQYGVPRRTDIYTMSDLTQKLIQLICTRTDFRKWVLKIDGETESKGLAILDTRRVFSKALFKRLKRGDPTAKAQIETKVIESLQSHHEAIVPVCPSVYTCQREFLTQFCVKGGVVEGYVEGEIKSQCFVSQISPSGDISQIHCYSKLTFNSKTVGCYFHSGREEWPQRILKTFQCLRSKGIIGYASIQLKSTINTTWIAEVKCHLDAFASAGFMRNIIAPTSPALYLPFIEHPAIRQLRLQTFFHLCRLQNISFDMERKTGNVFTFVDGLTSSCLGVLTFHPGSQSECFASALQVLTFLHDKLSPTPWRNVPSSFFNAKSALTLYIEGHRNQQQV